MSNQLREEHVMSDSKGRAYDPSAPVTHAGTPNPSAASSGKTEIERDADAAKQKAKDAVDSARQKANELGEKAIEKAADAAGEAGKRAQSFAEEQKDEAAGQIGGVADALRSAAGSLDDQKQQAMAGYARQAASGLEQVSDALSSRSLDDLMETVEDFARRQPVAFLGGAVLAGFVLARFTKSSSERRRETSGYDRRAAYSTADRAARAPLQSRGYGAAADTADPVGRGA